MPSRLPFPDGASSLHPSRRPAPGGPSSARGSARWFFATFVRGECPPAGWRVLDPDVEALPGDEAGSGGGRDVDPGSSGGGHGGEADDGRGAEEAGRSIHRFSFVALASLVREGASAVSRTQDTPPSSSSRYPTSRVPVTSTRPGT